jgi:hypothetical protein
MTKELEAFYKDYLNANSWPQRKDGVPLDLLDRLSQDDKVIAENELMDHIGFNDSWPIIGLGYMKSTKSIDKLYKLLNKGSKYFKIVIAHSIYQINGDSKMIDIAISESKRLKSTYEIIEILFMLRDFKDDRIDKLLYDFYNHNDYLVAYNAARVLGLSTDDVVNKFRDIKEHKVKRDNWIIRQIKKITTPNTAYK